MVYISPAFPSCARFDGENFSHLSTGGPDILNGQHPMFLHKNRLSGVQSQDNVPHFDLRSGTMVLRVRMLIFSREFLDSHNTLSETIFHVLAHVSRFLGPLKELHINAIGVLHRCTETVSHYAVRTLVAGSQVPPAPSAHTRDVERQLWRSTCSGINGTGLFRKISGT